MCKIRNQSFIGNNEYQLDLFNVGVRGCLDAGHLSLYLAPRAGRLGLLALALRGLLGRLRRGKDFEALCGHEARIEMRRKRLLVATDGEVSVMETPLHYRIHPGALRVVVPVTTSPGTRHTGETAHAYARPSVRSPFWAQ